MEYAPGPRRMISKDKMIRYTTKKEFISFGDRIRKRIPTIKISALITGVKKPEMMVVEKTNEMPPISHPRNVDLIRSEKKRKVRN